MTVEAQEREGCPRRGQAQQQGTQVSVLRVRSRPRAEQPQASGPKVKVKPPFGQADLDHWFGGSPEHVRAYLAGRARAAGWRERRRKRLLAKAGHRASRGRK
jgi:hypothetical protein